MEQFLFTLFLYCLDWAAHLHTEIPPKVQSMTCTGCSVCMHVPTFVYPVFFAVSHIHSFPMAFVDSVGMFRY